MREPPSAPLNHHRPFSGKTLLLYVLLGQYAMNGCMTKDLVSKSLFRAVNTKRPDTGLVHHSDRGSQYCFHEYRKLTEQFGMKSSMSRKGNYYDNAPMESFWGTLKSELVHHSRYRTRQEAIQEITEYIEVFYNRQRRQAKPMKNSYPDIL